MTAKVEILTNHAATGAGFYSICVLDLKLVKWDKTPEDTLTLPLDVGKAAGTYS